MSYLNAVLPLIGVALGWGLKTLSDYLFSKKVENRTFRKATFYILKAYKALLDYDRGTTYFRRNRPPVEKFEPWRATLEARFLEEWKANSDFISTAIEVLASIDPPLAIRLHNTVKNMDFAFRKDLSKVAQQDKRVYAELLDTQDELVAFTLKDLSSAALQIAKQSGFHQCRKVQAWIDERTKGEADFAQEMDEQTDIRERAVALQRDNAQPPAE